MCERPLSTTDLQNIAGYLRGTRAHLFTAISELGFDPDEYPDIRRWLASELGLYQHKITRLWLFKD